MADSVNLHAIILDALGWTEFPRGDDFEFFGEPEPCDNCEEGLCNVVTYDKRRLCRRCTLDHIVEMGWDKYEPPEQELATPEIVVTDVEEDDGRTDSQIVRENGEGTSGQGSLW